MVIEKETAYPFIQEDFPMPEYEEVRRELRKKPSVEMIREMYETYKNKLSNSENLDSKKKIEYEKIQRTLSRSLSIKDPVKIIESDRKYLEERFRTKNNV